MGRGAFGHGIPLVVGSCGVGLEVIGGRGGPRRGARVLIHCEGGLQETRRRRAGGRMG